MKQLNIDGKIWLCGLARHHKERRAARWKDLLRSNLQLCKTVTWERGYSDRQLAEKLLPAQEAARKHLERMQRACFYGFIAGMIITVFNSGGLWVVAVSILQFLSISLVHRTY
jgi:hypothetical protein